MSITLPKYVCISIEGNIGSGKSTILKQLKETYPEWNFVDEPVSEWMALKNDDGKSLLECFYADKRRWSFTFQNYIVLNRFQAMNKVIQNLDPTKFNVVITERSIYTDRNIFANMLHNSGDFDSLEWQIYSQWFNHIYKLYPTIHGFIYIHATPERCFERVAKRHRGGEDLIPIEYLRSVHECHESWLRETSVMPAVLVYDNNQNDTFHIDAIKKFVDNLAQ